MSLINDALRKARKDSAEKTAIEGRERPFSPRRNRSFPLLGILLIACLAAGLGGTLSWWLLKKGSDDTGPIMDKLEIHAGLKHEEMRPSLPEENPQSESPGPTPLHPEPTPLRDELPPDEKPSLPLTPTNIPRPTATPAPPSPNPDGNSTFPPSATIEGHPIVLDYLVYREEHPYAQINGIVVEQGAAIEGFLLEKVEKDRIELTKGDRHYIIRAFE